MSSARARSKIREGHRLTIAFPHFAPAVSPSAQPGDAAKPILMDSQTGQGGTQVPIHTVQGLEARPLILQRGAQSPAVDGLGLVPVHLRHALDKLGVEVVFHKGGQFDQSGRSVTRKVDNLGRHSFAPVFVVTPQ